MLVFFLNGSLGFLLLFLIVVISSFGSFAPVKWLAGKVVSKMT